MPELHPPDSTLLAMDTDPATGVDYIATGQSPYYLEFRRLLHRLLRAAERANDARVYASGALSIGVRGGRCVVGDQAFDITSDDAITLPADATTHVWIDAAGQITTGQAGLPADRTTFIPLAEVVTDADGIVTLTDLRGEAFLQSPSAALLGLTATPEEINRALAGASDDVTAAALGALTAGGDALADALHSHSVFSYDADALATLLLVNNHGGPDADVALRFSLPQHLLDDTTLQVSRATGFLRQSFDGVTHDLVGSTHVPFIHNGDLTASLSGVAFGVVPIAGRVVDVVLSVGGNIVSSDPADGVAAACSVNGNPLTTTAPAITAAAGASFRCTDQGDGTSAVVTAAGPEQVQRGDMITLDLTRTANGSVTTQARDVAVLVVIRPDRPE